LAVLYGCIGAAAVGAHAEALKASDQGGAASAMQSPRRALCPAAPPAHRCAPAAPAPPPAGGQALGGRLQGVRARRGAVQVRRDRPGLGPRGGALEPPRPPVALPLRTPLCPCAPSLAPAVLNPDPTPPHPTPPHPTPQKVPPRRRHLAALPQTLCGALRGDQARARARPVRVGARGRAARQGGDPGGRVDGRVLAGGRTLREGRRARGRLGWLGRTSPCQATRRPLTSCLVVRTQTPPPFPRRAPCSWSMPGSRSSTASPAARWRSTRARWAASPRTSAWVCSTSTWRARRSSSGWPRWATRARGASRAAPRGRRGGASQAARGATSSPSLPCPTPPKNALPLPPLLNPGPRDLRGRDRVRAPQRLPQPRRAPAVPALRRARAQARGSRPRARDLRARRRARRPAAAGRRGRGVLGGVERVRGGARQRGHVQGDAAHQAASRGGCLAAGLARRRTP
jgi:hypothetical protein